MILEGKYEELTFNVCCDCDTTLLISGDNDEVLKRIDVRGVAVPQRVTINVCGVDRLTIQALHKVKCQVYLVDFKPRQ